MSEGVHLHVAVGVIENEHGEILISKRHIDKDQGGLWEFPGGKIEKNESVLNALRRELNEELNIRTLASRPLISINHQYSKYSVSLDVHKILKWNGIAKGNEGQEIQWLDKFSLKTTDFPQANKTIITAAQLPDTVFVTPEPTFYEESFFLNKIKNILEKGIKLIQFRSKEKKIKDYLNLLFKIKKICKEFKAKIIVNADIDFDNLYEFDGLHLNSKNIKKYQGRPINKDILLMTSCHNDDDIKISETLDADAIILGSVQSTNSHPNGKYMGWEKFKEITDKTNIPVYGIGGLKDQDKSIAWNRGGQGIAMISGLWDLE